MQKTIIFDFDGTIADTVSTGVVTFNQLARQYGFLEITPVNADELRAKNPRQAIKALSVPLLRVPIVLRALRNGIRFVLPTLNVAAGMRFAILSLKEKGYRLGIVTTNSEENVRAFLSNNQIEVFDFVQAGVGLFNKASAVKKVIAREGLRGREGRGSGGETPESNHIVFVGDEIRDIEAARKNKITAVAVTWGINSREGLAASRPDFIVDTAAELAGLF